MTGRVAATRQGATWLRRDGPDIAPVAVFVHGLTTPSIVWEALVPKLGARGFGTLVYDLPGRGRTPWRPARQTAGFFAAHLREVIAAEGIGGPVVLVGYSMGAVIAAQAVSEGLSASAVILLAPAGLIAMDRGLAGRLQTAPVLGEGYALTGYGRRLAANILGRRGRPPATADLPRHQLAETRRPAFALSVLSSRRHLLSRTHDAAFAALRSVPTLAVWGEQDPVIDPAAAGRLATLVPEAHQRVLSDADHLLPQTHADEIDATLDLVL